LLGKKKIGIFIEGFACINKAIMDSLNEERLSELLPKLIRENRSIQDAIRDVDKRSIERSETSLPQENYPLAPRLGRRESEPHSIEISYLHDILTTNFPNDRVFWDLHHYFIIHNTEENRRFDISWFQNLTIPVDKSHYKAWEHGNRVPDLVVNILSVSTWKEDLSDLVEFCREVRIPYYVVFAPYHVASRLFSPPFLRVYKLNAEGQYDQIERHGVVIHEGQNVWAAQELIDLGDNIPFRIGLQQLARCHESGSPRFRLILIDQLVLKVFPSSLEKIVGEKDREIQDLKKQLDK
jgi:Uma2 family endonuclease